MPLYAEIGFRNNEMVTLYIFLYLLLTFSLLLHLIGKGTRCNGTIFVTELSKQQYYAEDDNYRHDDAYGSQFERATSG